MICGSHFASKSWLTTMTEIASKGKALLSGLSYLTDQYSLGQLKMKVMGW